MKYINWLGNFSKIKVYIHAGLLLLFQYTQECPTLGFTLHHASRAIDKPCSLTLLRFLIKCLLFRKTFHDHILSSRTTSLTLHPPDLRSFSS